MGADRAAAAALAREGSCPRPVPDRLCLQGILYMLHNDIAWQLLPLELELELESARARPAGGGWSGGRRGRAGHHRGPGHGNAVTGAPGSATAEGADRR
ncbi:hypothetical protein [Streptomyces avermitilis]|uniref:hypothetical protein n=1 Tax=Streptomyces avermitilis TaxID=33903 RepID=UPI0033BEDFE6